MHGGRQHKIGDLTVTRTARIKRGVIENPMQLLADRRSLYQNHRTVRHPDYGSWEGHQKAMRGQQLRLRESLEEWFRKGCDGGGGGGTKEAVEGGRSGWRHSGPLGQFRSGPSRRQRPPRLPFKGATPSCSAAMCIPTSCTTGIGAARVSSDPLSRRGGDAVRGARAREAASGDNRLIGWAVEGLGRVTMPSLMIWIPARTWAEAARGAAAGGDVEGGMRTMAQAERAYHQAYQAYATYKEGVETGAGQGRKGRRGCGDWLCGGRGHCWRSWLLLRRRWWPARRRRPAPQPPPQRPRRRRQQLRVRPRRAARPRARSSS